MKQKIYILGLITVLIVFSGIVLKLNHLAGAQITITIGFGILLLLFMPSALLNHYKSEGNKQNLPLYIVTYITCLVVFTSALFKIDHWPFAGTLLLIAIPFPYIVFLPAFLWVTSKNKNFNIHNTVFVLLLLIITSVFSGLLALNVSKNRIIDSYNISGNYDKVKTALNQIPDRVPDSGLTQAIDEALKTVNEYQEIILKQENMTKEKWDNDPGSLMSPDVKGIASHALFNTGGSQTLSKLHNDLKNIVHEMEVRPGCKELAKAAPEIFDMIVPSGDEEDWFSWKFKDNHLAWVLIYLDGLETNLKMIKASVIEGE
jgi:hypothetical protein